MKINITNREIYFAVENCFGSLKNSFTSQLYALVSADDNEQTVQEIDIDKETFITIMRAVNSQPHGVALNINPAMYDMLKAQLVILAQGGDTEAIEILTEMTAILNENAGMLKNKILNGKTQILS